MTGGIIDSSILIDCLRGRAEAISFLAVQSSTGRPRTHLLVAAELLTGARDRSEQNLIDSFLQTFDLTFPNEADGLTALDLYRQRVATKTQVVRYEPPPSWMIRYPR
jgi:predicted nucleic acid-binding protein